MGKIGLSINLFSLYIVKGTDREFNFFHKCRVKMTKDLSAKNNVLRKSKKLNGNHRNFLSSYFI